MPLCPNCNTKLKPEEIRAAQCAKCGVNLADPRFATVDLSLETEEDHQNEGELSFEDESLDIELEDSFSVETDEEATEVSVSWDGKNINETAEFSPEATLEFQEDSLEFEEAAKGTDEETTQKNANEADEKTIDRNAVTFEADQILTTQNEPDASGGISDFSIEITSSDQTDGSSISLSLDWDESDFSDANYGNTIEQRPPSGSKTVSGFRSSLPVKSRHFLDSQGLPSKPAVVGPVGELPDYELLSVIGEGGMGIVYSANQSSIARTVAVKMLKSNIKPTTNQRDKFISEAVVTGELDHPNIVPIYDLGANDSGALFYSMKSVKGTPWDEVIGEKPLEENLNILLRVADAVAYAHENGVVHRDLKPENVMLGSFGEVLVMDWGLARVTNKFPHVKAVCQIDSLGGTPAYMSPEMALGPVASIDHQSDIYLLGGILYEIIGGRPPHTGKNVMDCLQNASINKLIPTEAEGELLAIALQALETKQADRHASVQGFQKAVRVYLSHSESLLMTANSEAYLAKARQEQEYQDYAKAQFGFNEALALWSENKRAAKLLQTTTGEYAKNAYEKGDLDLAASLLDRKNRFDNELFQKIEAALADRVARARRLKSLIYLAGALSLVLVVGGLISYWTIVQEKNIAQNARDIARQAEKKEKTQRLVAVKEKEAADQARSQAVTEKLKAENAEKKEKEQRLLAVQAKIEAEQSRAAEQYEAYVARIGLAAAKIEANAYRSATALLKQCPPELRNWEWGRLRYLSTLDVKTYPFKGPVDAIAISPDRITFATGDWAGQLSVTDLATGQVKFQIKLSQYIHAVEYSPDGSLIACGCSDHLIRILESRTGKVLHEISGHTDAVLSVCFSPDGKRLLSSGYDNTARIWDLKNNKLLQTLRGHSWWVWEARFSPSTDQIITASQDGRVVVWEKKENGGSGSLLNSTYKQVAEYTEHEGPVYSACFSPAGRLVASAGYDKKIRIWNPNKVYQVGLSERLTTNAPLAKKQTTESLILVGHDAPVRSLQFSKNGLLLVSGSYDNSVRVWNPKTGTLVKSLRGHGGRIRSVAFTSDSRQILSGAQDETVRRWDLKGYRESMVLQGQVLSGHTDAVLSARFSSDGKSIVTASRDRTAKVWDVQTGKQKQTFSEGHAFLASNVAFFPDGKRMATGAGDNSVRVWDLVTGTQRFQIHATGRSGVLAISPDGNYLVTGGKKNSLQVWNAQTGKRLALLSGHKKSVTSAAFGIGATLKSPPILATGDEQGTIILWQPQPDSETEWDLIAQMTGHSRSITSLKFSSNGKRLISASGDKTVGQWDIASRREIQSGVLKHTDWVTVVDVSQDGSLVLTGCDDGFARVWSGDQGSLLGEISAPREGIFNSVTFTPDGRFAILTVSATKKVYRWDLKKKLTTILDFEKIGGMVWSAACLPNTNQFVTVGGNDARLWSLKTSQQLMRFSPHGAIASAAISPDQSQVATGSWDFSTKIWDFKTGQAIRKLANAHTGYVNSVDYRSDASELLTASDDGTVCFWNATTGALRPTKIVTQQGRILQAKYSADGKFVVTASSNKKGTLWLRKTGKRIRDFVGHQWGVLAVDITRDNSLLVTGSDDARAIIWNVKTGQEVVTLAGHTASVTAVAFSPDGSRVVTASRDNTAKLWDTTTGKEILTLSGHDQELTSVSFSPDGQQILTSGRGGKTIVWYTNSWAE